MSRLLVIFLVGMFFIRNESIAQATADTAFVQVSARKAINSYHEFILGQSGLYSGSEYRFPERTNESHPFYKEFDWLDGSVEYNGEVYENVSVLYDITSDLLIIENFLNGDELVLVKAKVGAFTIGDEYFEHMNGTGLAPGLPSVGFYRIVYNGPSRLVARYVKAPEEKIESSKVEKYFTPKYKFYVLKNGVYERVTRRSDVLKLFSDKKKELRAYSNREKLLFTKADPSALAKLVRYYDSLKTVGQ